MPKLVLIPKICRDSWLHWSFKGDSSCLRDFRKGSPIEMWQYTTHQIEKHLAGKDNYWEKAPRIPLTEHPRWCDYIWLKNDAFKPDDSSTRCRLLKQFKKVATPLVKGGELEMLRKTLESWISRFEVVEDKTQFNHWDNTDATSKQTTDKGIGWTSHILEYCRPAARGLRFVDTMNENLDFALLAMELNLGISSRRNQFQRGKRDFIKPDGLGVRRDGSICVLEVKGPKDDPSLLDATLQALCGSLAVYAKRRNLVEIAKKKEEGAKRPAVANTLIPKKRPTLGLYIIAAEKDSRGKAMFQWSDELTRYATTILRGFPALREIVYFKIDPTKETQWGRMPVTKIIPQPKT